MKDQHRATAPGALFHSFSASLFALLGLLVSLLSYQHFSGRRLAFHAHKTEAYYLYSIIAPYYDRTINIWHWSMPMRDRCFDDTVLPAWAQWNRSKHNADTDVDDVSSSSYVLGEHYDEINKLKIVDVGAGTGFTTLGVVGVTDARTTEITMLDQSDHQLAEAAKKPLLRTVPKLLGDSHFLPFHNESFHRWVSAGSVEYWSDPVQVYSEAYRVLKDGGVAFTIGPIRPTHWLAKLIADYWYLFPDAEEYTYWHQKAGFEEVEIIDINPEWYGETDRSYGLIMGVLVVARKGRNGTRAYDFNISHSEALHFLNGASEVSPSVVKNVTVSYWEAAARIVRFLLGGVGALYYTFLPMYVALKTTGWGVGDSYSPLIPPTPRYVPALGCLVDYLFGLAVAECIWLFVSAHLVPPVNTDKQNGDTTLKSIYRLARPHTIKGTLVATLVGYLLAATFTLNYTEHLMTGIHILLSGIAVNVYIVALNQLTDVDIDVENKKPLPIATGDLSWNNAKRVTHISFLLASSLALGGVNATWWVLVIMALALLGTLYSLPPYRLKKWSSSAAACIALARGCVAIIGGVATLLEVFQVDAIELREFPVWEMGFTFSAILLVFCTVIAITKDVPDVAGDQKANISTLAIKWGSSNLMKIAFALLLFLYTAIVVLFTMLPSKVVTPFELLNALMHYEPYRMDTLSLTGFHVLACAFLVKNFMAVWHRLDDKRVCMDLYINTIWNLFYFELIAFPLPCLIETLRYRGVIAASTDSVQISFAVIVAIVAPIGLSYFAKEQIQRFVAVADRIQQVKSIKSSICNNVLDDKALFSKTCPSLLSDDACIFSSDTIRSETEAALASQSQNNSISISSDIRKETKAQIELDASHVRSEITRLTGLQELSVFHDAAGHIFKHPGKMIRSRILILLARSILYGRDIDNAGNENNASSADEALKSCLALAVCTDMSHCASLLHDDVVDGAETRRGVASTCTTFGNKLAILAGDYLFSRALRHLTVQVGIDEVTANVSQVLEDLTKGEVVQMSPNGNHSWQQDMDASAIESVISDILDRYWVKTYLKTASLFALTCRSVARIANCSDNEKDMAEAFGRNFGMAFQLIDDLYDYDEHTSEHAVGKPVGQDLKLGLATLPVILAARAHPKELLPLILRNFAQEGDVERAMSYVMRDGNRENSPYMTESRKLIEMHLKKCVGCLMHFPKSEWRDELVNLVASYRLN